MAEMTADQAAEWGKTLDFPTVWAALMKNEAQISSMGENFDQLAQNLTENVNKMAEKVDRIGDNVGFESFRWRTGRNAYCRPPLGKIPAV